MNCLWLILLLACCGGQNFSLGNDGCGCGRSRGGNSRRDNDCGRRGQEDDCGCDGSRRRGVSSMPSFGRNSDNDTCGCEQED